MESRRNTRPGVLHWTPAPTRNSSAAALTSEDSWEDEDAEEDEFVEQMDENGIIGLSDALENWEFGKPGSGSDPCIPEEAVPSGGVEDHKASAACSGMNVGLKAWTEEEKGNNTTRRRSENWDHGHVVSESAVTASFLPHLYHFTEEEELAAAPGIEEETFPDMGLTETDSYCSHASVKSTPRRPETKPVASPQPEGAEEQKAGSLNRTRKDSLKSRLPRRAPDGTPRTPGARNSLAGTDEFRGASLTHQTPNFTKVEPRVHFPKQGYKPPKSKQSLTRSSLTPEPPMVFKSPADIVKEVLFNHADGSSASSDCDTRTDAATSTVPPEFRSRQQASALFQQLQEDYDRLLTKYAEAENTIDRLRLEAKVNLYSDLPQAGHSVHSGLNRNASNLLMLDFSPAQRAEICSAGQSSHQEKSDACSSASQLGQQLSHILSGQSEKFLQQLQIFKDLLKTDKLTPLEKLKGLSQLSEGLNSLERGYLLARDEHKLLQQRGEEVCHFDPERELEGLVFQCGLRLDELKEQVEQIQQEQPPSVAFFPSSPPLNSSSSDVSEGGETAQDHLQSPSEPFLVDPGAAAEMEGSSASKKSNEEEDEDEDDETLKSLYSRPLIGSDRCVEPEQTEPLDHGQTLKQGFKPSKAPSPFSLNTPRKHGGQRERQGLRNGNNEVQETFAHSRVESDPDSQRRSRSGPSSTQPAPSVRRRRSLERRKSPSSSLSSLTDVASEQRSSKLQAGSRRVLSQDRIISPETDSGFVGSESSRLTLHQRASESVSAAQDRNPDRPQSASLSLRHLDPEPMESPTPDSTQRRRNRQRRRTFSHSPQSCISQKKQARADNRSSNLWTVSDIYSNTSNAHSASEEHRSDSLAEAVASPLSSLSTSAPAARHRHGDPLRAPNPSRGGNHEDALMTLHAEVERLKERLDFSLRNETPPSPEKSCSHLSTSSPLIRECWSDASLGRRSARAVDEIEQESVFSRTLRGTRASATKQQRQCHVLRKSEPDQAQSRVSRCTQTSAAPHSISSVEEHSRNTKTCSLGGSREPSDPPRCCCCCNICGRLKLHECTDSDCHRRLHPSHHLNHQPADSPDRASNWKCSAALHYVPCYPPQLLLSSTPAYPSPDSVSDSYTGMTRSKERRGRRRRSNSVDGQRSKDGSLDRAIQAARHMKHTSGHMARSLASGLQHHKLLAQSSG